MATESNNETLSENGIRLGESKTRWRNSVCSTNIDLDKIDSQQKRMLYLLCRGPKYTTEQAKKMSRITDLLSNAYSSAEVCIDKKLSDELFEHSKPVNCLKGEPDLEKLMMKQNLSPDQMLFIWKSWHDTVGPAVKSFYPNLVKVMNDAATANGYSDIGEIWREELEIPNLENYVKNMYNEIQPLYSMLHAVVRHKLYLKYGSDIIDPTGPIPVHLLGNMWAQDWSSLINLLIPKQKNINLDMKIAHKNWTVKTMVEVAEDVYLSMGLPKMTDKFWKYSKIESKNLSMCHGSAANMFEPDDYRIFLCAQLDMQDFYMVHHELGHIEYYMSYEDQPTIFQDGANSAFQESIGDAIMTGVMVPQHLHRLGLISDQELSDESFGEFILLQQALSKIPQISFALLTDLYRWEIFSGKIKPSHYNSIYWKMTKDIRGITSPEVRSEQFFDAGAKFHIPDNTPYIRYFLSAFIQADIFNSLCKLAVFGKIDTKQLPFPLYKCDIYGSKPAGKHLREFMAMGASQHWSKSYKMLTGRNFISHKPLLHYFQPIYKYLENYIALNNVFVGW